MADLIAPVDTYTAARTARTNAEILADLEERLRARGFTPESWAETDYKRAITEIVADIRGIDEQVRADLATMMSPDTASGPWLEMLAGGFFFITPTPEVTATIQLRLTDIANIARPPITSRIVAPWNPEGPEPLYYFRTAPTTIPKGGYIDVEFTAEEPGAVYNIPANSINSLTTPIPGVVVSSPPVGESGSIMLTVGRDKEGDASLRQAVTDKWSLLRRGWAKETIRALIREAMPKVTRTFIRDDNPLPGEAWAYMATPTGPITPSEVLAVYEYLRDGVRKPVSNKPVRCFSATALGWFLEGRIYTNGAPGVAKAAFKRAFDYMYNYDLGAPVYRSRLEDVMIDPSQGVQAAEITNFPEVYTPSPIQFLVFTVGLIEEKAKVLI